MSDKKVELEIYVTPSQGYGITIYTMRGLSGSGYRIVGPKLYGQGRAVSKWNLDEGDIDDLILELKSAKKFLRLKK